MFEIVILISSTGNFKIITLVRMTKLKNIAFVGNPSHFENKIDLVCSGVTNSHFGATVSFYQIWQ